MRFRIFCSMLSTSMGLLRRIRILTAQLKPGYSNADYNSQNYYLNPFLVSLGCIVCNVGEQSCDYRHTTPIFNDSYKDFAAKNPNPNCPA